MSPAIGEFAVVEAHRLRQVNARLLFALRVAQTALEAALVDGVDDRAYCPRCDCIVHTIDDGATCASCRLVL